MNAQTVIPRLRVGAGQPDGSDGMCAMQVISWENGDTQIVDMPACADPMLARIVQGVNDRICIHRTSDGLLCPACSVQVLELAHRTVGTAGEPGLARRRVWVRVAADQARQVVHLAGKRSVALAAIEAAEAWAENPTEDTCQAADAAAYAAYAAYAAATDAATTATADAATTAAADAAAYAAYAAATAADAADNAYAAYAAATYAATTATAANDRLRLAHRAIDLFLIHTQPATPHTTAPAVAAR